MPKTMSLRFSSKRRGTKNAICLLNINKFHSEDFFIQKKEENDRRNYFMINLHESMVPGRDRSPDP